MNIKYLLLYTLSIAGCNFPAPGAFDPEQMSYEEFETSTKRTSLTYLDSRQGTTPVDCGTVVASGNPVETNACLINALSTPSSAFAFYKQPNGSAFSISLGRMEDEFSVSIWRYGSEEDDSELESRLTHYDMCLQLTISNDLTIAPFNCIRTDGLYKPLNYDEWTPEL